MRARAVDARAPRAAPPAAPPTRIVSLAPAVTETLFALGEGGAVVGVSQYCDYPPAATHLPKVGTFLTPNVEAIAALRPDLIIGPGLSSSRREVRTLEAMGYPTLTVNDNSLAGIEQSIALIGARTGRAGGGAPPARRRSRLISKTSTRVLRRPGRARS